MATVATLPLPLPWLVAAVAVVALVAGAWLARRWQRWRAHRRMRRLRGLGTRGERRAGKLLSKAGFSVEAWQVTSQTVVAVDGVIEAFVVRADAIATRRGERYVVEIKGGKAAARLSNRATRRQLLEYATAFDVDGVVLVDAAAGRVRRIVFPDLRR